jgi:hypothetical protein
MEKVKLKIDVDQAQAIGQMVFNGIQTIDQRDSRNRVIQYNLAEVYLKIQQKCLLPKEFISIGLSYAQAASLLWHISQLKVEDPYFVAIQEYLIQILSAKL